MDSPPLGSDPSFKPNTSASRTVLQIHGPPPKRNTNDGDAPHESSRWVEITVA